MRIRLELGFESESALALSIGAREKPSAPCVPAFRGERRDALQEAVRHGVRRRKDAPQGLAGPRGRDGSVLRAAEGLRDQAAAHAVRDDKDADLKGVKFIMLMMHIQAHRASSVRRGAYVSKYIGRSP